MKKRCCIVGAAPIADYVLIRSYLSDSDFFLYCDAGLKHEESLGFPPDLIVGDFDSYENPNSSIETIVLPTEKDDTDTVFGIKEAIKRGFKDFILIGCIGERLDHTLGNLSLLLFLQNNGCRGLIVDDYSEIEIVSEGPATILPSFPYFSLLNIGGEKTNVSIKNAKYPLSDACLSADFPLGISNEPLPGQTAEVIVNKGHLLLVRVFDSKTADLV